MYSKKSTILVVDDELQIRKMLSIILGDRNFKVVESTSGQQAIRMCASIKPDLILLDLDLPDIDGKKVLTALREWSNIPIIILSACSSDEEITAALNSGANDYIIKPFNADVLVARINVVLRMCAERETSGDAVLRNGPLHMDLVRHEVTLDDKPLPLTPKEYDLLRYLMINRGRMLTHKDLLKKVWGEAHSDNLTYLRVYIGQLREKIEHNPKSPDFIVTESGVGYRMEVVKPDKLQTVLPTHEPGELVFA